MSATTVSNTAYAIATIRAMESERPASERLFDDPFARVFSAGASQDAREGTERFLSLPNLVDAVRLRTRAIDDVVREGVGSGLTQIVLLGAGFDARALRLPELARVSVFEVDFPHLLEQKRALLEGAGIVLPPSVRHVACDFGAEDFDVALERELVASGFRAGAGAVFVWEGVLAYLDARAADRTMAFVARLGGPGTRLVFEFATDERGTFRVRAVAAGFDALEVDRFDALWRRYLRGEPHEYAPGMSLGVARLRSETEAAPPS